MDELLHVRDDFERQKRDMETFYKNQLQTLQQKQTRDIKDHLERGLCVCVLVSLPQGTMDWSVICDFVISW